MRSVAIRAKDAIVSDFGRMNTGSSDFPSGNLAGVGQFPFYKSSRVKCTMHKLKFKSTDLIRLVEQRPMLWDRTCVQYVNKISKDEAWNEIYNQLYPSFSSFSRQEQQILGAAITAKWRNLRDAFIRSIKRKQSAEQNYEVAKNYIYYDHLKFLLHRKKYKRDHTVTQSNIDYVENVSQESMHNEISPMAMIEPFEGVQPSSNTSHHQTLESATSNDELDPCHMEEAQAQHQQEEQISHPYIEPQQDLYQLPDEDTAFFASITPSVRNMTEDEKLEFRIGALELIRKIKQTRKIEQLTRLQASRIHTGYVHNGLHDHNGSVKQEID